MPCARTHIRPTFPRAAAMAAALALPPSRPLARAENAVAYTFENYREEDGRITVETQSGSADQDIGQDMHLRLTGTVDAITGATPTGEQAPAGSGQVPTTPMHHRRKAWSGDLSRQFSRVNVDLGFANSRENDYNSRGWSVNTLTDFNRKNTTLSLGAAGTSDRVEVFFRQPTYLPKRTNDFIAGITQLLDPLTSVTLNVTLGRAKGYLSEPHKLVEKDIVLLPGVVLPETFGENRPNRKEKESLFLSANRAFPAAHGAVEASYRFYRDTFGTASSTLEASWFQHLGGKFSLEPSLRLYTQTAAHFYAYNLNATPVIPTRNPIGFAPYYSSDFRLSALDTVSWGLKAAWKAAAWMEVEARFRTYDMRGTDGVTPASAYIRATIGTGGIKITW
jgi:hypothetical protein